MPTVEVDLVFFVFIVIIALVSLPLILGWTLFKGYRNPEFWLRLKRQDWIYVLMKTPLGRLKQVCVSSRRIGKHGRVRLFGKRTYYLRDQDQQGRPSVITWRHGKPGYLMDWRRPFPLAWAANPGLEGDVMDPATVASVEDQRVLEQIMLADFNKGFQLAALALSAVSILAIVGMAFAVFTLPQDVNHLSQGFNNFTRRFG